MNDKESLRYNAYEALRLIRDLCVDYGGFNTVEELKSLIDDVREIAEQKQQTFLENTAETREYLEPLPKIYMIAKWAGCGVREFPFAGKCDEKSIPFVYDYDDCNGTCDRYFLRKLTDTTTGWIYAWTTSERRAKEIAAALNEAAGESWRND